MKHFITNLLLFISVISVHAQEEISQFYENLVIPLCPAITSHSNDVEDHEVHTYSGFTLCYRESYEQPEWVAYVLTAKETESVMNRTDDFRPDPAISTGSADLNDYKKSGYDRGHLAPAADMEWSERSTRESFLMSNMSPQTPSFNRGIWKKLEDMVRDWAQSYGFVCVVTGPVLEKDNSEYQYIGSNKVSVPEYYYKALLSLDKHGNYKTIAFIIPNTKCSDSIWNYAVTIDALEERTGLDFYSMLDDSVEAACEKSLDIQNWQ